MTRRKRKPAMPDALKERARADGPVARAHAERYPAPWIDIGKSEQGWTIDSPYRSADEEEWWRLLGEAFGTRTKSVIAVFMDQVASLLPHEWDAERGASYPREADLQAALSIVAAMKPRNEAEAAQAAQAFALHRFTMKLGADSANRSAVDPRTVNAMANLVKAYSGVMDSMRRGRGGNTKTQKIVVKKDVRIYQDNRSIALGGGGASGDHRRDAAERTTRARGSQSDTPCNGAGTGEFIEGKALLSPPQDGGALSGQGDEGSEDMPDALGREAVGTEGRGESRLQAREGHAGGDSAAKQCAGTARSNTDR